MNHPIATIATIAAFAALTSSAAAELTVCSSGCDFAAIQDAADAGDAIVIGDGTTPRAWSSTAPSRCSRRAARRSPRRCRVTAASRS